MMLPILSLQMQQMVVNSTTNVKRERKILNDYNTC